MNISFAWTTPALLAGRKTVSRRHWNRRYAGRFKEGDLVNAYDRNPRYGGRHVAIIQLTRTPYQESSSEIPDEDWEGEGFAYLEEIGTRVNGYTPRELWDVWHETPLFMWVVRFELAEILDEALHEAVASEGPLTP